MLRKSGRAQAGGSQRLLKSYIAKYDIDVSHFTGQRWKSGPLFTQKYTKENLFVKDSDTPNVTLIKYLLKYGLKPYRCSECGCGDIWRGKKLTLQLHHVDGDTRNNTVENLTFLCPNCHSVTDNYGGKKNVGQIRVP